VKRIQANGAVAVVYSALGWAQCARVMTESAGTRPHVQSATQGQKCYRLDRPWEPLRSNPGSRSGRYSERGDVARWLHDSSQVNPKRARKRRTGWFRAGTALDPPRSML